MRFRRNLERIGEIASYEISKKLNFEEEAIETPLGTAKVPLLKDEVVLATIMRAGLPIHQGFLNYFDKAENAFVSMQRKSSGGIVEVTIEYLSAPNTEGKIMVICDSMIATGITMEKTYKALVKAGIPKHTHIFSIIASKEGIEHLHMRLPRNNITIWVAAIDDELTSRSLIVPGLGDAGDLAYGHKKLP